MTVPPAHPGGSSLPAATLTYGVRELVWGIESELAVIGSLTRRIDEHVAILNELRGELADRLLRLDELHVATAGHQHLAAFVAAAARVPLPVVDEDFPDRLYGG